jgi:hypothetical protein
MYKDIAIISKCNVLGKAHRVKPEYTDLPLTTFITVPCIFEYNYKIV